MLSAGKKKKEKKLPKGPWKGVGKHREKRRFTSEKVQALIMALKKKKRKRESSIEKGRMEMRDIDAQRP